MINLAGLMTSPSENRTYGIIDSLKDLYRATKSNPLSVLVIVVLTYITSAAIMMLIGLLVAIPLLVSIMYGSFNIAALAVSSFVALAVFYFFYVLAMSLMLSGVAHSLSPKRPNPLLTIKKTFASLPRTTIYFLTLWLVALAPFAAMYVITLAASSIFSSAPSAVNLLLFLIPLLSLAAIIWVYIALIRFAMVPLIAILNPKIKLKQSFAKSRQLLANGGQWFIFKGALILFGIAVAIILLTDPKYDNTLPEAVVYVAIFVLLILMFLAQGCLTMLYLKKSKPAK